MDNLKKNIKVLKSRWSFSIKPQNIILLPENYIQDENKTVKWNKDFVLKNNQMYYEEVKKIKAIQDLKLKEAKNSIVEYIAEKSGLTVEKASLVFDYIFPNKNYTCNNRNTYDIINSINKICVLINKIGGIRICNQSDNNWVSVDNNPPVKEGKYLVAIKDGDKYNISVRKYKKESGFTKNGRWERGTCGVRYWQNLPIPPKGDKSE